MIFSLPDTQTRLVADRVSPFLFRWRRGGVLFSGHSKNLRSWWGKKKRENRKTMKKREKKNTRNKMKQITKKKNMKHERVKGKKADPPASGSSSGPSSGCPSQLENNYPGGKNVSIVFSCNNRADEFESGREDGMNCGCTVEVNCAPSKDCRITRNKITGTNEVLFRTGSRITPLSTRASNKSEWFFSPLSQRKVRTANSKCVQ